MQLMRSSDLVILGILASSELVTTYALTKYASEMLITFVAILVFGSIPGLGGIIGTGDLQKATQVRGELMLFTWLVTTVVGSTILLWNQTFIQLWVGAERYAGTLSNFLIMISVIQLVLIRNDASIIDLTLNLSRKVLLGLLSALLSVGLAVVFMRLFETEIVGLVLGLMAGRTVLSLIYPLMIGRFLTIPLATQLKMTLRPTCVTILLFGLGLRLDNYLQASTIPIIDTWLGLIPAVGVTTVGVFVCAFILGLSSDQQRRILKRARLVLSRVSK